MSKQTRSIHIPLNLHTKLKIEATKRGMKLGELINELLEKAIKEVEWWQKDGQMKKYNF